VIKYSIIITNYNYHKFLDRCISSSLNQDKKKSFEVLIVDDGSSSESIKIIKKYKNKNNFKAFFLKNNGIEKAANFGILNAKGKYIIRVDADDLLVSNFLTKVDNYIMKYPNYKFYYSNYFIIDEDNKIISTKALPKFSTKEITERGDFLATGTVYEKKTIIKFGLYDTKKKNCGLENYSLILKLILSKLKGFRINEPLFFFRVHKKSMSKIKIKEIKNYGSFLAANNGLEFYKQNKHHPSFI
jgi:glycosyltransferase involved in cell wall biosynthesis